MCMQRTLYARTIPDEENETLMAHALSVSGMAAELGRKIGFPDTCAYHGATHDIGKATDEWQNYLLNGGKTVPHSYVAILLANMKACQYADEHGKGYFNDLFPLLAYPAACHHTELRNMGYRGDVASNSIYATFNNNKKAVDVEALVHLLAVPPLNPDEIKKFIMCDNKTKQFLVKMMASINIEADRKCAERMCDRYKARLRTDYDSLDVLLKRVIKTIDKLNENPQNPIDFRRREVYIQVKSHAKDDGNYFTLTAQTGAGKTLSSLAFMLENAIIHKKDRIIICVPFCSIITQTYEILCKILGSKNVVAHFSEYVFKNNEGDIKKQLAIEDWDAPIIITSDVQFFESFYGNKASVIRKNQNMANAVILFDEAQELPAFLLQPCVAALAFLMDYCNSTVITCTATQPSLQRYFDRYLKNPKPPIPLYTGDPIADKIFDRVTYKYLGYVSNVNIAKKISNCSQVLCVVNNKKQAITISKLLVESGKQHVICLTKYSPSGILKSQIKLLRKWLNTGEDCIVISTRLIEAGVDISFPVVYKAISGLDSIIQAGGRCNRHGLFKKEDSFTYIFDPEDYPPKIMEDEIDATRRILKNPKYTDITSPEAIDAYFKLLFSRRDAINLTDIEDIMSMLNRGMYPYEDIADAFKIIEDNQATVYVFYDKAGRALEAEIRTNGIDRNTLRKIGTYAVNVSQEYFNKLVNKLGIVETISDNSGVLTDMSAFTKEYGLKYDL